MAATMAAATAPPESSVETTANCAEPAKVVADMTTAATTSKPAAPERMPKDAPNAAAATAIGAIRRAPSRYREGAALGPATREVEPEREPGVAAVAAKAPFDGGVLDGAPAVEARVRRPRPRVEDQGRVAAHEHHHVRGGIGTDAGERQQAREHLLVRELVRPQRAQLLQVDAPVGDRARERDQVRPAVASPDDVAVEILTRCRHRLGGGEGATIGTLDRRARRRLAEVFDESGDHALGRRPCAVGRADRLDDVLEDRRAPDHATRSFGRPGEVRVVREERVEVGEVFVETENVGDGCKDLLRLPRRGLRTHGGDDGATPASLRNGDRVGTGALHGHCELEQARLLVHARGWERGDAVGDDRPPEVDLLSTPAGQR